MNKLITIAMLFIGLSVVAPTTLGQTITCACRKAPGSTCSGNISCPTGCTSLCGSKNTCHLSCRTNFLDLHITYEFVNTEGPKIAAVLSERLRMKIEFVSYPRNVGKKYNLNLRNDDLWTVLRILDKEGLVKVGNTSFDKLRQLRKESTSGKKISVTFHDVPAREVLDRLSFMSGRRYELIAGDPNQLISISLQEVTLKEIIENLSAAAGIKIKK